MKTLLHKRFVKVLQSFMDEENITVETTAWLLGVTTPTIYGWMKGKWLPQRRSAMKLAYYSDSFETFFKREGGVDTALERLDTQRRRVSKAA